MAPSRTLAVEETIRIHATEAEVHDKRACDIVIVSDWVRATQVRKVCFRSTSLRARIKRQCDKNYIVLSLLHSI
jgi:riboflavin synthase